MATGNSTDNVLSGRFDQVAALPLRRLDPILERRVERARELIRAAVTLTEISASAAVSAEPVEPHTLRRALAHAVELLEEANDVIDPVALVRVATDEELRQVVAS
jgi:signal transduction histidine kinase